MGNAMKTNLEYIRAFFGEREETAPLFSDDELTSLMKGHLTHVIASELARRLAAASVNYRVADDSGRLHITLNKLITGEIAPEYDEFYAGVGNWQDDAGTIYVNDMQHSLGAGEGVDYLHGSVGLAGPLPEGTVVAVETYLVDMRSVLIELTRILKASRARLAVRAQLAGLNVDLSQVSRRLEKEIEELSTSYELPFNLPEDFPH